MYRARRGMGQVENPKCAGFWYSSFVPSCGGQRVDWWSNLLGGPINEAFYNVPTPPTLAKGAAAPTPEQLATIPPAELPGVLVAQQTAENQDTMQQFYEDAAAGIPPVSSTNWLMIGAGVVGVFALSALGGGSPRRYGR